MSATVLVIDDESTLRKLLSTLLRKEGYHVVLASDGSKGLVVAAHTNPDLIILDLLLPGISGHEVCARIRQTPTLKSIPIMVLTANNTEKQLATCLDEGADDYLTKPFDLSEFRARVRALLRRPQTFVTNKKRIEQDGLIIDVAAHHVSWQGRRLHLAPKEFDLLSCLAHESPRVVSKHELAKVVWGTTLDKMHQRTMDVHVHRIRVKLGSFGIHRLKTIPALGYQWVTK